jgi:hypothetical protein
MLKHLLELSTAITLVPMRKMLIIVIPDGSSGLSTGGLYLSHFLVLQLAFKLHFT